LAADLLKYFERDIDSLILLPSSGGRFEVTVNQQLIFSKAELHRHAIPGEIITQVTQFIAEGHSS